MSNFSNLLIFSIFLFAILYGSRRAHRKVEFDHINMIKSAMVSFGISGIIFIFLEYTGISGAEVKNIIIGTSDESKNVTRNSNGWVFGLIAVALTALVGISVVYTRNALLDIRDAKAEIDQKVSLEKLVREASHNIIRGKLYTDIVFRLTNILLYRKDNPEYDNEYQFLREIQPLFSSENPEMLKKQLNLILDQEDIRIAMKEMHLHKDYIRHLPEYYPEDSEMKILVGELSKLM